MSNTTLPEAIELEYQRIRDILAQSAIILQQQAANWEAIQQASADTDHKFQETDRQFKETDRQFKETDRKFKETDRKLARLENLFETQWGRLMESLVDGDLVPMLRQRGILVTDTTCRLRGQRADGGNFEFDIVAHNGLDVVVIEVKTTLRPDDIRKFLSKLKHIKQWIPRYQANRLYAGMAWLTTTAGADIMLQNRGLFSIRATGNSASILNPSDFSPRTW
jgi:hypothetical protein